MKHNLNRRICLIISMALVMCLAAGMNAHAMPFNSYHVDVDAIKELAGTDTFDVKVVKKVVADDVNTGSIMNYNPDMLTLTVEAGPAVSSLSEVVIMVVCYDEGQMTQSLTGSGIGDIGTGKSKRQFAVLTFSDLDQAGGTFQVSTKCDHDNFTGAQALVAQYTGMCDGKEVQETNPLAAQWQELALGSPTHILD